MSWSWLWSTRRERLARAKPLTIDALRALLIEEDFDPDSYSFDGGLPEERLVMSRDDVGWCVYYSERGRPRGLKRYATEGEACADMLSQLVKSRPPQTF